MSTIQIADKTTLDNTKTNTTNLLTKGGIKYNATTQKYQTYNTTNSSWVDTEFGGGGGSPTLVVKNIDGLLNNKSITVSNTSLDFTSTKSMGTSDYIIFDVPLLTKYDITDGTKTMSVKVDSIGGVTCNFAYYFISFNSATDEQINALLDLHYNNILNISDVWAIGDKRTISLSTIAQDVEVVIIDFEHDDLVEQINGHKKAAITLSQVDCLNNTRSMNSSNTNNGSWSNSGIRLWCNDTYYNALPSTFKSIIKHVNKITAASYSGSTNQITSDYCWLLASGEIFGGQPASSAGSSSTFYSNLTEFNALAQYPYYAISTNRIKKANGSACYWWERSPTYNYSSNFCIVTSTGSVYTTTADNTYGIAPAMCL